MSASFNSKVGIFGGTFNPLHMGHINSMKSVKESLGLDAIKVIPAHQSPHRKPVQGPSADQRLEMVYNGLKEYEGAFEVDDREVVRGGVSYTIDTLDSLIEESRNQDLYLIIGTDQFEDFDKWKRYAEILEKANLVVTSRPGSHLPVSPEEFPVEIKDLVVEYEESVAQLSTGKKIYFIQLNDLDVSATEVRKRLREGDSVEEFLPLPVRNYIKKHKLYESLGRMIGDFEKFTHKCANSLFEKNGINVQAYDVSDLGQPSEFSLIASGTSTRHTSALAENLIRNVKKTYGVYPQHVEGLKEGRWVVLDYGALMVHLFYDYVRMEYQLEKIWQQGKMLTLVDPLKKDSEK